MTRAIIASTIVLGLAGLLATLTLRASASLRHAIWFVGLVTALGVGVLAAVGPVIEMESPLVHQEQVSGNSELGTPSHEVPVTSSMSGDLLQTARSAPVPRSQFPVALMVWGLGVAFIIGRSLLAHVAVARLIDRSRHLDVDRRLEVDGAIDVRLSADVDGPFTLGARHPVILLPLEAEQWDRERLRIVLVHEAAHIARLDYVAQLVATIACAIYWFNPIAWLAASRLRAEAEHAADDRVLAAGVDGVTYASHLLELARPERAPLSTAMAVGMARGTSRLERRFTAMLDSTRSRGVVPLRLQAIMGTAALCAAVPFTSVRLVPVAPTAPIVLTAPAPLAVVAPAVLAAAPRASRPAVKPRVAKSDTLIDRTVAATAGERISIDLPVGGMISIVSWNQPQVRMRARLSGDQASETQLTLDRVPGGLDLRAVLAIQRNNTRNSNEFELWVPRRFDVKINSAGGAIMINSVQGTFSGSTGGGEIVLNDVQGEAQLSTGGGEVRVTNSNLEGYVTTGGGRADVTNTTGGVRVSSGSGPVVRDNGVQTRVYGVGGLAVTAVGSGQSTAIAGTGGNYAVVGGGRSMSWAGGDIRLDDAPQGGSFTTGGGDIVVGSVGGTAAFTTGGGAIRLSNVSDDVTATTGAGSVEISVVNGNGVARNVMVTSGNGQVVIELPANYDGRFDLESAYTERNGRTKIESDFPVSVTETDYWDDRNGTPRRYVRATGQAGSGRGLIKIRTVNGDVVIRRR